MSPPGGDDNRVTGARQNTPVAKSEPDPTPDHGEPFLLLGVGVTSRGVTSPGQEMFEAQQLAAVLITAFANHDRLAADRIVDYAALRHRLVLLGRSGWLWVRLDEAFLRAPHYEDWAVRVRGRLDPTSYAAA